MLIGLSLFIMFVLTVFSWILGSALVGVVLDSDVGGYLIINGTKYLYQSEEVGGMFYIDPVVGAITMFVIIIAFVAVLGINILGSGLNSVSVKIITLLTIYIGLWVIMSFLAMPLIVSITYFGAFIYIGLTIVYVYGIIDKLNSGVG